MGTESRTGGTGNGGRALINEILLPGKKNAQSGRDICSILNITPRTLTQLVEAERRAGKPICATSNGTAPGYYLAENQEEMQHYCAALYHRAGEIFKTRRACLKTIDTLPPIESGERGGL